MGVDSVVMRVLPTVSRRRRSRATVALVLAFALLPALAVSADAATATRTLRARIGPSGTNGTATLRLFGDGTGTLAESVRRLQPHVTYSQGIYHGVCGSLASRTIRLPNVKATRTGLVVRTWTLTTSQVASLRSKLHRGWKFSMVVGGRCGRFLAVSSGASGGAGSVPALSHVYVIVMENKEYGSIVGSSNAPYLNGLIAKGALATNYRAVAHPSEPNYLALWSGSTQGVTDDGVHNLPGTNIADQLAAHGKSWRVFAQNVPLGCSKVATASGGPDGTGTYARKHEPAISFTDISGSPARCANITDFSHFDPAAANFELIVPNLCNDMHDCSVATGDTFLSGFVPGILGSSAFKNGGVLFITWDEGSTSLGGGGRVATIAVGPGVRTGYQSTVAHTHYSLVRTIENAWGLGCLNKTCAANDLREIFK